MAAILESPTTRSYEDGEAMHVVTVEFAIVLDGEVPLAAELKDLTSSIRKLYEDDDLPVSMPNGSWRVVSVGPEEDHRDLDPCFNGYPEVPGWPVGAPS